MCMSTPFTTLVNIPIVSCAYTYFWYFHDLLLVHKHFSEHLPTSIFHICAFLTNNHTINRAFFLLVDIPIWLKSLRLHKYQFIFESLSYDEMMEMSDETLAHMVSKSLILYLINVYCLFYLLFNQQVTQGARNKILQNIKKLTQRTQSLLDLEKVCT